MKLVSIRNQSDIPEKIRPFIQTDFHDGSIAKVEISIEGQKLFLVTKDYSVRLLKNAPPEIILNWSMTIEWKIIYGDLVSPLYDEEEDAQEKAKQLGLSPDRDDWKIVKVEIEEEAL